MAARNRRAFYKILNMKEIISKGVSIIVDDDVFEWASKKKWCIQDRGYTKYVKSRAGYLHRIIMKVNNSRLVIDHLNGNGLDNRRENLRICSSAENAKNRHFRRIGCTSKYWGVYYKKNRNKYEAHIKHNGKMIYIGIFNTEIEAAMAYNSMAIQLRGGESHLNKI